jgi:hypothetical protein
MRAGVWVVVAAGLWSCGPVSARSDAGGEGDAGPLVDPCRDLGVEPPNLVVNGGFECGGDLPAEWGAIHGTLSFPAEGRSGRAAKLVADDTGARLGYLVPLATASRATTYCARAWMKGTAPSMRVSMMSPNRIFQSNEKVRSTWWHVPFARAELAAGEGLSLLVELQVDRADGANAKPGDLLWVDDVDVWVSATGRCDER